jgi:hypothetical protein
MSEPNEELARLAHDPAWKLLGEQIDKTMEKHFTTLAREFATKDRQPDYADLQWYRGFYACMKAWHRAPVTEAKELAKLLAQERGEQ